MCANSEEGSGETVRMRRLTGAFAGRLCDKYHNLMSWLKWCFTSQWKLDKNLKTSVGVCSQGGAQTDKISELFKNFIFLFLIKNILSIQDVANILDSVCTYQATSQMLKQIVLLISEKEHPKKLLQLS